MCPSPARIITASEAESTQQEAFPYFAATFAAPVSGLEEGYEDDEPLLNEITSPEEDAARLASVDQQIYEKLQQADREAQDIARRAYEEGFSSGESEGRAFGESQYASYIQRLEGHLQEMSESCRLLAHASEEEILGLALAFGEYLAGQQILQGPQAIRPLLQSILDSHPFAASDGAGSDQAAMIVYLNPKDLEELGDAYLDKPGILLREDLELSRGSLRLETPAGVLDASMERRRNRLVEMIHREREQGLR
jgi:flagellar biosynthesis/type III secretory pathway protein FliH